MTAKILFFAAAFAALVSCTNKSENAKGLSAQAAADAKQFMSAFREAWNRKDSVAVMNMVADDAVLLSGKAKLTGKKEVLDRWVRRNMPVTGNLKLEELRSDTGDNLACTAGTWSVDVTPPNRPATTASGNHTFVLKKGGDGNWKMIVLNLEDHNPD